MSNQNEHEMSDLSLTGGTISTTDNEEQRHPVGENNNQNQDRADNGGNNPPPEPPIGGNNPPPEPPIGGNNPPLEPRPIIEIDIEKFTFKNYNETHDQSYVCLMVCFIIIIMCFALISKIKKEWEDVMQYCVIVNCIIIVICTLIYRFLIQNEDQLQFTKFEKKLTGLRTWPEMKRVADDFERSETALSYHCQALKTFIYLKGTPIGFPALVDPAGKIATEILQMKVAISKDTQYQNDKNKAIADRRGSLATFMLLILGITLTINLVSISNGASGTMENTTMVNTTMVNTTMVNTTMVNTTMVNSRR